MFGIGLSHRLGLHAALTRRRLLLYLAHMTSQTLSLAADYTDGIPVTLVSVMMVHSDRESHPLL